MIGKPKNMTERRQRHYNECKTLAAVALMLFGACAAVTYSVLWPQDYIATIFNSKLAQRAIIDSNDYYTCTKDYVDFVLDEPGEDTYLMSFYIFSVSNAPDVLQRGYKPYVKEEGPFGFTKRTYKYDIIFDPVESAYISYKEYSYLEEVTDPAICEKMFYRTERSYLLADPCADGNCLCKNSTVPFVVVNPLFLKFVWKETPHLMLAHFSLDVFQDIKNTLNEPFTEAVKAHVVTYAYKEITLFRTQMHAFDLINTAYTYLIDPAKGGYTTTQVARTAISPAYCGLDKYSISECSFSPFSIYLKHQGIVNLPIKSDFPNLDYLFNASNSISFLNGEVGFPRWLGLCWYHGDVEFNSLYGYSTVTRAEMAEVKASFAIEYCTHYFGASYTAFQYRGCTTAIESITDFLGFYYINPYSIRRSVLQSLVFQEFIHSHDSVVCAPNLRRCTWQWGYMQKNYPLQGYNMSTILAQSLIDVTQQISTNPNHLYQTSNAESWYNMYMYYNEVYTNTNPDFDITCTDYGYTLFDAHTGKPAGLWAYDFGVSAVNLTYMYLRYNGSTLPTKQKYFQIAWRLSNLVQKFYRNNTDFHDHFVIAYLNKYKDPALEYTFSVGNWSYLGYAQYAGGYVTQAIANVRTVKQLYRNGMWRIGKDTYHLFYYEYSSWCVKQGFPYMWFTDPDDARILIEQLARSDDVGLAFRQHIFYRGSTLIGDGINFENEVGLVGEKTFTPEANHGDFSCQFDGDTQYACALLDANATSSATECTFIQDLFTACVSQSKYQNNLWINITNCGEFETAQTSPTQGIQCDPGYIFGHAHPYTKKRGNVVYSMMYALTLTTALLEGLWCESTATCDFSWGGMFATATPRQVLFEGYTESSIIKYMNLKYAKYNISFECQQNPYDKCGRQLYRCNGAGVVMKYPDYVQPNISSVQDPTDYVMNYSSIHHYYMRFNQTNVDEYFTSMYVLDRNSSHLLWPNSMNTTLKNLSLSLMMNAQQHKAVHENILYLENPFWTAYPAWHTHYNESYLKFLQCSKRILFGIFYPFASCDSIVETGLHALNHTFNIKVFYGNATINLFANTNATNSTAFQVAGSVFHNQYPMYQWAGFSAYPYSYQGESAGPAFLTMQTPVVFHTLHNFKYILSQNSLIFDFQKAITVSIPFPTGTNYPEAIPFQMSLPTRRFVEDSLTWQPYRSMGASTDSYGMSYRIPMGMSTLQSFADFPMFLDTPHSYGNMKWGGIEYTFVLGTVQNEYAQRTFIDYDPITGKAIRQAIRQQVNVRIEASALFPNAFSSQQRCIAPSKTYAFGTGYGCFAYVPIYWFEEARLISREEFYQTYDHYYTRPARGQMITNAGITIAVLTAFTGLVLFINELYYRRKFHARVYVD